MQGLMCVIDGWIFPLRCSSVLVGCFLNPHSVVFSLTAFPFSFLLCRPFAVPVFYSHTPSKCHLCLSPPVLSLIVAYLYLFALINFPSEELN